MARVQLALNVAELDSAIDFYSQLFRTEPHKVRPGYANFEVADPPLKLVLIENGRGGDLNHLGVEVESTGQVVAETQRLGWLGHELEIEDAVVCCHAEQDKVWVRDPAGLRWEVYTITDDQPAAELVTLIEDTCCAEQNIACGASGNAAEPAAASGG